MVFAVNGLVRWKGKKLANGIDGRFETNDEKIIKRLETLGFKEYSYFNGNKIEENKIVESVEIKSVVEAKERFKCEICGAESTTKAGIASHKRFNHKEVTQ